MSLSNKIIKSETVNIVPLRKRQEAAFTRIDYRPNNNSETDDGPAGMPAPADDIDTIAEEAESSNSLLLEEAYERGIEEGIHRAREEAKGKLSPCLAAIEKIMSEISIQRDMLNNKAEETIFDLAFAVAEKIIRREVVCDRSTVKNLLQEILGDVAGGENLLIRLNPEDLDALQEWEPLFLSNMERKANLKFEKDSHIEPGGAVVETREFVVDGRIDEQLKVLYEVLPLNHLTGAV
ncbi:MAG: FliH/SctL family protein [Syntrophales bacterium]|nr:FliH/SctL family protein [Syntrophales bacterium]MDY0043100.1 FliH/SctL family protein [Syntrophales bacterium]